MSTSELRLPYPRPLSLSDPFSDYTPEYLESLLNTPDSDLQWNDFQCLLGPFLPAGTYEESSYFLSLAFEYILSHDDDDAHELVTSLVWFASENAHELRRDNVLDAVRSKLTQCLDYWTAQFDVAHYDREACQEKGWGLAYSDHIQNFETVMEAISDLLRFKAHDDLALSFYADLAGSKSDAVKSAWFLGCVRAYLERKDVYRLLKKSTEIRQLLDDEELAIRHAATVRETLPGYGAEPTYWHDTFTLLGIVLDA